MGAALYTETNDFNYKNLTGKRRKSADHKIIDLEELDEKTKKKKGLAMSPSMAKMVV